MGPFYRCYAEGSRSGWEAICLDLDIAVQADNLEAVVDELNQAIRLYLESVADLPEAERAHLLERPVPLGLRLRFAWAMISDALLGHEGRRRRHEGFTCPRAA